MTDYCVCEAYIVHEDLLMCKESCSVTSTALLLCITDIKHKLHVQ